MCYWTKRFNLDKEYFTNVPIWIRLYSLPRELWKEEGLVGIGNTIEPYIKTTEVTRQMCYTTYVKICVYMNVSNTILESILLSYEDS